MEGVHTYCTTVSTVSSEASKRGRCWSRPKQTIWYLGEADTVGANAASIVLVALDTSSWLPVSVRHTKRVKTLAAKHALIITRSSNACAASQAMWGPYPGSKISCGMEAAGQEGRLRQIPKKDRQDKEFEVCPVLCAYDDSCYKCRG